MKILIVKLGALGDILRTTSMLRVLKGDIFWVTKRNAMPLLAANPYLSRIVGIEDSLVLKKHYFDLILCLDEEPSAVRLASSLSKGELIGSYYNGNEIKYTDSSKEWFDMSLVSKFGRKAADQKKRLNRKSYQEILFSMIGKKFNGEEYILPKRFTRNDMSDKPLIDSVVGIEARAGERWVAKRWPNALKFSELLKSHSISSVQFHEFPTLMKFVSFVNQPDYVVTTDSLSLHIALGLKKKVVGIFTCTSPHEIYGYNRLVKLVSPLLSHYFYSTKHTTEPGKRVLPQIVYQALLKMEKIKSDRPLL